MPLIQKIKETLSPVWVRAADFTSWNHTKVKKAQRRGAAAP